MFVSLDCFLCYTIRERGVVWEETIILLPDTVRLVFLSATIPNAREFTEWICRIKHQVLSVKRKQLFWGF